MSGNFFLLPTVLATDPTNGIPGNGAKLFFYENGTATPKDTYTTPDLSTEHSNPVVADSGGYFPEIYLDGVYSWRLEDSLGNLIDEGDDYSGPLNFTPAEANLSVATLSDLQAITTSGVSDGEGRYMRGRTTVGDGYGGNFAWVTGDQSANVSADTEGDTWIAPDGENGSNGAWKRISWLGKTVLNNDNNESSVRYEVTSTGKGDAQIYERSRFNWLGDLNEVDQTEALVTIQSVIPDTGSTVGFEKDGLNVTVKTEEPDDSGGQPDAVAIRGTGKIVGTNTNGRAWSSNFLSNIEPGGDGFLVGCEINIKNGASAEKKELGPGAQKIGLKLTTKDVGDASAVETGTAAIHITKGSGQGWYKGLIAEQADFPPDSASRFIELTDLFEIQRDGTTHIGKGVTEVFTEGALIEPDSDVRLSKSGGPQLDLVDTEGTATRPGIIRGRAQDAGGNDTIYSEIILAINDNTDGSEDGKIRFRNQVAGTLTSEMEVADGVIVGAPTGLFQGVGILNAKEVQDDGSTLTDYVFDAWHRDIGERYPEYSDAVKAAADEFDEKWMEPASFSAYWKRNRRLPGMPDLDDCIDGRVKMGLGAQIHKLTQVVELQAIHIDKLNQRIRRLED